MSWPPKGHDRGVSGPYFATAQVLEVTAAVQASRVVPLTPPLLTQLPTDYMSAKQQGQLSLLAMRQSQKSTSNLPC